MAFSGVFSETAGEYFFVPDSPHSEPVLEKRPGSDGFFRSFEQ
jgi:hypothetical protein